MSEVRCLALLCYIKSYFKNVMVNMMLACNVLVGENMNTVIFQNPVVSHPCVLPAIPPCLHFQRDRNEEFRMLQQ